MTPALLIVRPGGAPLSCHTYGPVPPVTVIGWLYPGCPAVHGGSEEPAGAVIAGCGLIVIPLYALVAIAPAASVSVIVGLNVPVAVARPLIAPESGSIVRPVGSPDADHA